MYSKEAAEITLPIEQEYHSNFGKTEKYMLEAIEIAKNLEVEDEYISAPNYKVVRIAAMKYLFTVLFLLLSGLYSPAIAAPGEVPVGGQLRNMPMQGLTAQSGFLSSYFGKPLIINVWASYCGPCLAEMGSLERLWQRHGEHFNVIGISIDDYRERADAFLAKAGTTFPHFIDRDLMLENMFGAKTIPLTLLVDAEGRVLQKVRGAKEWDSPEIIETIGLIYEIDM